MSEKMFTHTFQLTEKETEQLEKRAKENRRSKASQIAFYVVQGLEIDEEQEKNQCK